MDSAEPEPLPTRVLVDFDRVLGTAQEDAESQAFLAALLASAARVTGLHPDRVAEDFRAFEREVVREPRRHGWPCGDRLTAYADEDGRARIAAVARRVHLVADDTRARPYRLAAAASPHRDFLGLADAAWQESLEAPLRPVPGWLPAVIEELERAGTALAFASERPTAAVEEALLSAGASPSGWSVHGEVQRFVLGPRPACLQVVDRAVPLDRPAYRRLLERVRPQAVLGAGFSLDLALPAALRRAGTHGAPRHILLFRTAETPHWVEALVGGPHVDLALTDLRELPELLTRIRTRCIAPALPSQPREPRHEPPYGGVGRAS